MTHSNQAFAEFLLELLGNPPEVKTRAMFGGMALYREGLVFGIIAESVCYVKVDEVSRSEFENAQLQPFTYFKGEKPYTMSYYTLPEEALEHPEIFQQWAEKGYQAAQRAAEKRKTKKTRKSSRK